MGIFRLIKYNYLLKKRRKYASLAVSIALAHASFGQVKYRSIGNGMADITLALEDNQKFKLDLNRLPDQKKISLKGTWSAESENYVLRFNRNRKNLKNLFFSNSGFEKLSEVQDARTVVIPKNEFGVIIDGIYCLKS